MGDDQRRERKQFEPPPWEREAFEALAAKRAEQDAAAAVAADALAAAASQAAVSGPAPAELDVVVSTVNAGAAAVEPVVSDAPATKAAAKPDSKAVQMMMMQLATEEAMDRSNTKVVAWVAAGVTAVLGLAMVIAGVALATQAAGKSSALIGSAVLTVFGLAFMGMAAWVWISSNRVRGR